MRAPNEPCDRALNHDTDITRFYHGEIRRVMPFCGPGLLSAMPVVSMLGHILRTTAKMVRTRFSALGPRHCGREAGRDAGMPATTRGLSISSKKSLATTYSPTLKGQYHRRGRA